MERAKAFGELRSQRVPIAFRAHRPLLASLIARLLAESPHERPLCSEVLRVIRPPPPPSPITSPVVGPAIASVPSLGLAYGLLPPSSVERADDNVGAEALQSLRASLDSEPAEQAAFTHALESECADELLARQRVELQLLARELRCEEAARRAP